MMRRHVFGLLTLLVWTAGAFAQDKEAPKDKTEATHDEIRAVRDGVLKAVKAKDVDALLKYLHPDVVLTAQDGKEQKVIRKHDGVRAYLARQLTGPSALIKSIQPDVTVDELTILHGDATGVAFGSSKDHYVLADGSESVLPTRWSATLVKHDGTWKVANLHFSTSLFDNPVLTAVNRIMYWVGGIAAGVGFLAGLAVMWLVARSRKPT
jgi:ketosteroid isomerase-like protein